MGILDGIKSIGRGIASIPGRMNRPQYGQPPVPASMTQMPGIPPGTNPDDLVTVGFDPDTGEPIQIPQSELGGYGYNPKDGQVMRQPPPPPGPSKMGSFLSGIPRILDAGIAAATAPGHGTGGALDILRGMDAGRDRLEKRDMLQYQMARQRRQDQIMDEERMARAAENRAQADMYRQRMNAMPAAPKDPLALLRERAKEAGLVPGTKEYQNFMLHGGAMGHEDKNKPPVLQSRDQWLIWRWQNTADPVERAQIEEQMKAGKPGSGGGGTGGNRPTFKTPNELLMYEYQNATDPVKKAQLWELIQQGGFQKPKKEGAGTGPRKPRGSSGGMTATKADQIESDKAKALKAAQDAYEKEVANIEPPREIKGANEQQHADWKVKFAKYEKALADAKAKLLMEQTRAQRTYEQRIKATGASISETWDPAAGQAPPPAAGGGGASWRDSKSKLTGGR